MVNINLGIIVNILSLIIGIIGTLLTIVFFTVQIRNMDKKSRNDAIDCRRMSDMSHSFLRSLTNKLGPNDPLVDQYNNVNHQLIVTLAKVSMDFAEQWVKDKHSIQDKETWKSILYLK